MTCVDYKDYIRKATRGGSRLERFYRATHKCGHQQYLRLNDARKAGDRLCQSCSNSAKGKKGFKSTMKKHGGKAGVMAILADSLRNGKISKPEQWVYDLIAELGYVENVDYTRQAPIKVSNRRHLIADFAFTVNGKLQVIEVAGYWHKRKNNRRDAHVAKVLEVLFVDADLITSDPDAARDAIVSFLKA